MFTDRTDAGEQLAATLRRSDTDADVVLGIPRGGLPVARPVADALDRPLDVVVAKKVGAPGNDELAVAAVADDGLATGATLSAWLQRVTAAGAASVVAAVPVGSPRTADSLSRLADDVVVLDAPQHFSAVGQFYEQFAQVSDDEAMALLE